MFFAALGRYYEREQFSEFYFLMEEDVNHNLQVEMGYWDEDIIVPERIMCGGCLRVCPNKRLLSQHMRDVHDKRSFI